MACAVALSAGCGDAPTDNGAISVRGAVVEPDLSPSVGARVFVAGAEVPTDAQGRFRRDGVVPPYDVVILPAYGRNVWVYRGLTRIDPTLLTYGGEGPHRRTEVRGALPRYTGFPSPYVAIWLETGSPRVSQFGFGGNGRYTLLVDWPSERTSLAGRLHVLVYDAPDGLPVRYRGHVWRDIALDSQPVLEGIDFPAEDFTTPATTTVQGRSVVPAGYLRSDRWFGIHFGNLRIGLGNQVMQSNLPDEFAYVCPILPGALVWISERALQEVTPTTARGSLITLRNIAGQSDLELMLEPADRLLVPAADATAVDEGVQFAWSRAGRGVFMLRVDSEAALAPHYHIFQMDSTCTLPELPGFGRRLAPDTAYFWQLERFLPAATMNDVASVKFADWFGARDGGLAHSEARAFRTTPVPTP